MSFGRISSYIGQPCWSQIFSALPFHASQTWCDWDLCSWSFFFFYIYSCSLHTPMGSRCIPHAASSVNEIYLPKHSWSFYRWTFNLTSVMRFLGLHTAGAKLDGLTRSLAHPRWRTSEAMNKQGSVHTAAAVWVGLLKQDYYFVMI